MILSSILKNAKYTQIIDFDNSEYMPWAQFWTIGKVKLDFV